MDFNCRKVSCNARFRGSGGKIPEDKISKYLKSTATAKDKEDFLAKAVEYYGKHLMKQKDRGAR